METKDSFLGFIGFIFVYKVWVQRLGFMGVRVRVRIAVPGRIRAADVWGLYSGLRLGFRTYSF